jgi:hypothetical protein
MALSRKHCHGQLSRHCHAVPGLAIPSASIRHALFPDVDVLQLHLAIIVTINITINITITISQSHLGT